jgi:hypothetical protein
MGRSQTPKCAGLFHLFCQHDAPVYSDALAADHAVMRLRSNAAWAQSGDDLGGPLMNLGFPLQVLWEPATPAWINAFFAWD